MVNSKRGPEKQLEVLSEKVTQWINSIMRSLLSSKDKQIAYTAFLKPQIVYPIGCASIAAKDLKRLFWPVMDVILHTLGLNRNSFWPSLTQDLKTLAWA